VLAGLEAGRAVARILVGDDRREAAVPGLVERHPLPARQRHRAETEQLPPLLLSRTSPW
jgi:hypothetical protein